MKKLLILALTSAFVAAANADNPNQFGVASSTGLSNAEWKQDNQTVERTYTGAPIGIDEEASSPLVLSPTASFTAPDPQVKTVVEVVATFTAISDFDSLESPGDDAKTALTVANDGTNGNKYYYWNPASEAENKWTLLGTTATPNTEQAVTVVIELDNSTVGATTAKFTIGDAEAVSVSLSSATTLGGLAFAGTGSLTSVAATVTPAYAAKTVNNVTTRYATIADAGEGDITLYKHNGSFGTMPTANDKLYFPASVSDNTASLYSFTKVDDDYQITSVADLKALVDLTAYDNTAYSFKQTTDLTLTEAWPGIGIQNGKDLVSYETTGDNAITPEEASQRDASWNAGAFKGTYDGGNHTISGFQMVGVAGNPANNNEGLDYCGFFNSVDGATIKNLNIQYAGALFAVDTTASTKESGATFVGVAKNSTLQNLTSLQKDANTAVSCSKGFGGIVGYTTSGTTVDSCTNNVNMTSLAGNKCGGIAMITQKGSAVTIRNCQNNGTTAGNANQKGGIVGYVGVATTIADCEDTAGSDPSFLHHETGTLTMTGVNKAPAGVKSYTKNKTNISGLNFATVDGNVATFVADNALAKGYTYKVMTTGATATATLTAGDTISFDETLFTPTYAITAASGLVAPSTSGKVTTYTASTPVPVDGGSTDATLLVSVPQDCKASQLIDTSNRASKDLLRVLNKATNKYYQWEYDGNGGWTPNNVVQDADNVVVTPAANTVDLTRGQAVWVTRTDTNEPIKLNAVYTDDPVEVAVSIGYNLVAPALKKNATKFELSSLTVKNGSFNDKDMIVIPGAAAPINCVRKDNEWKVYRVSGTETPSGMPAGWGGIATGGKYEDAPDIPSGKGFFFVSKEEKTIEL